ncbi:MAG: hypothetical protein ACRYF3_17505 [Janthinobacterium lividum]
MTEPHERYNIVIVDEDANPNDAPVHEYRVIEATPGSRNAETSARASIQTIFLAAGFGKPEQLPADTGTVRAQAAKDGRSSILRASIIDLDVDQTQQVAGPASTATIEPETTANPHGDPTEMVLGLLRAMKHSEQRAADFATAKAMTEPYELATPRHAEQLSVLRRAALTASADTRQALQHLCRSAGLDYGQAWRLFDSEELAAVRAPYPTLDPHADAV